MSQPIRNPNFQQYTPRSSGDVQTGEIQTVRGGGRAGAVFSGNAFLSGCGPAMPGAVGGGYDVLIMSGAGRLNSVIQHTQLASGFAVLFYDSAVPTSGGPFPASGHKIVGALPPTYAAGVVSGVIPIAFTGASVNIDFPFQSGLCVALKSGQPGFSYSFTPEISLAFPAVA